jgi:hypothetical protein
MMQRDELLMTPGAGDVTDGGTTVSVCAICGIERPGMHPVAWFVGGVRRVVHTNCWIEARERGHFGRGQSRR